MVSRLAPPHVDGLSKYDPSFVMCWCEADHKITMKITKNWIARHAIRLVKILLHSVEFDATKRNLTQLSACTTAAHSAALNSQKKTLRVEKCDWS